MQTRASTRLLTTALLAAVSQTTAFAAEPVAGYWTTPYGESVMGGSGECVRNIERVREYRQECGYELITGQAASVDTGAKGTAVTVAKSAAVVRGEKVKASATVIEQLLIPNVEFAFDSSELTPEFASMLDRASEFLEPHRPLLRQGLAQLSVIGHTDSKGPEDYNQALSERRAEAVAAHLIQQDPSREAFIKVMGRGESEPIASNDSEEGRQRNRRVVLEVIRE